MLSKSHIGTSVTTGLGLLLFSKINDINIITNFYEFIPGIILGACFPDIDTAKSWVAQSIPLIDDKLRQYGILKHRGLTHGISGITLAILLFLLVRNNFMLGFSLGYITHCIGDAMCTLIKFRVNENNDKKIYNVTWILNSILILLIVLY